MLTEKGAVRDKAFMSWTLDVDFAVEEKKYDKLGSILESDLKSAGLRYFVDSVRTCSPHFYSDLCV